MSDEEKKVYEKDYKDGNIGRKIFSNEDSLLKYMANNKKTLFNAGFKNAEIRLFRIEDKE